VILNDTNLKIPTALSEPHPLHIATTLSNRTVSADISSDTAAGKPISPVNYLLDPAFRLQNLEKLMATQISSISEVEKHIVIEQILAELPELVKLGVLHPFDATLAHIKARERQNARLEADQVENLQQMYVNLYPSAISLPIHAHE
jgi:hypothetical protein